MARIKRADGGQEWSGSSVVWAVRVFNAFRAR